MTSWYSVGRMSNNGRSSRSPSPSGRFLSLAARIGAPRPARTPPALGPDDAARAAMMLVAAVAEGRLDGAVPDAAGLVAGLGLGATPGEIRDRLAALREGTVSDAQSLLSLTAGQGALRDRLRGLGA